MTEGQFLVEPTEDWPFFEAYVVDGVSGTWVPVQDGSRRLAAFVPWEHMVVALPLEGNSQLSNRAPYFRKINGAAGAFKWDKGQQIFVHDRQVGERTFVAGLSLVFGGIGLALTLGISILVFGGVFMALGVTGATAGILLTPILLVIVGFWVRGMARTIRERPILNHPA
jgi:hypothetical protein